VKDYFEQYLEAMAALAFIGGYAKEAIKNAEGRERDRLETIIEKTEVTLNSVCKV